MVLLPISALGILIGHTVSKFRACLSKISGHHQNQNQDQRRERKLSEKPVDVGKAWQKISMARFVEKFYNAERQRRQEYHARNEAKQNTLGKIDT
ncbi:hypothetical protein SDC9_190820 [bioreactor metagenome]|uniref:Uncharacterized protein n=1 Tax=bioreactor metagenome TaxID=1076179 RepID=A0A645HW26_9ZZZZ